jgi:ABC-type multidrug transport system fused ATPase/permease subunit
MRNKKVHDNTNPYISLLRTAWQYAVGQRGRYLTVYGLFILSNIATSGYPIIWGMFINELQLEGSDALRSAWMYIGAHMLLHFIDWASHGPARVMEQKLAFDVSRNFLQEMYHKTVHLPVKWHQDHHSGSTINRVRKAYEALKSFFSSGFMYFGTFAKMFMALGAMVYFSPLFGGVAVVMGVIILVTIFKFDKPYIEASKETNEREHEVSANLFDSLSNIITVITLRLEQRMESGLFDRVAAILPPYVRRVLINEWKWFTVSTLVKLMYVVIVVGYIYQNWTPGEVFLVGGLVTLVGYVNQFTGVFHNFAWQYTQIVRFDTDVRTADNIIDAYAEHQIKDQGARLPANWSIIDIRGLNFLHKENWSSEKGSLGLYELDLRIRKGGKIALIGESGSGKSTLLALLRGLYQPETATVTINDEAYPFSSIAKHVTLFPQEPEIFENTIEYNITLGLPFPEEEVEKVCRSVQFADIIEQLPQGLESNIKEKGVNLSGGQKQRLALARGVLAARDSDIVLMDEPTSSVDPKTELLIYEQLFDEFKDKAVISSLHRLHLLTKFDYVYVLDKGRVADEGTFAYLLQHSKTFQELWKHQEEIVF